MHNTQRCLAYLNNAESTGDNPNENYGRELLELHSVGLDADYSEQEMYDSALIMTGFTLDPDTMLYRYDSYRHFTGPVKVLDFQDDNADSSPAEKTSQFVT